jgi:acyl-coenzyme A synthetase/AMP-(fatty) acid ligase/ankyrin repeat protein
MANADGLITVCDYARWRACDLTTRFREAVRYYETLNGAPTTLSFGELVDEATRLSDVFAPYAKSAVCDSPPCCVITLEDGVDVFTCQLAAMFAGMAVSPMSTRDPAKRLASVFADMDVRIVIVRDGDGALKMSELTSAKVFTVESLFRVQQRSATATVVKADDASHVFFTSGSTGRPKGCVASHAALLSYCEAKNTAHEIDDTSVVYCASSHMFDPHFTDFCSAIVAGCTLISASREVTFARLGDALRVSSATHCLTTPVLLSSVREIPSLKYLRLVALGGETMSKALAGAWLDAGVRVANTYGVTECVAYQTFREIKHASNDDLRVLGDPLPGNTFIFAAEPGDDPTLTAKAGELAELWIGGRQVGNGYLNRPELTAARFKSNLYRTGDIVKISSDGRHILVGRRDDQVKISGQRVELGEVEDAIRRTCSAFTREVKCVLASTSKQLIAYCTGSFTDVDAVVTAAMRYAVAREIPQHMVPSMFVFLDELPMTSTGKVSRADLSRREVDVSEQGCAIMFGEFGADLARIWSDELGVDVNHGDADFTANGGDSLRALRVVQRVKALVIEDDVDAGGGTFGEALGAFAPIELLQRPRLNDYARFIRGSVEDWPSRYAADSDVDEAEATFSDIDIGLHVLIRASAAGHVSLVKMLIDAGVSVDPNSRSTPLHVACANARVECVRALLDSGASVNALGTGRRTPLIFAASSPICTSELVKILLGRGAAIGAVDEDKQTVLHAAARVGAASSVIDALLDAPSTSSAKSKVLKNALNVNALDVWGRTALHWASVNGHRNACKSLLERDVDASIKDLNGETARDIAERRALCSAQERPKGGRPSTWGDIANLLGGSGATKHLKASLA